VDLNLRKKLVKCNIWSIALYGAEIWTLREVDQTYMKSAEMRFYRRMETFSWSDRVRTENVLRRVKGGEERLTKIGRKKCD
jgi:hypothetical protein